MRKLNSSREDYLEAVLVLGQKQTIVRAIDLAAYLKFTKPSVSRAVAILRDDGYVTIDLDNHIALTAVDIDIAEKIYARHCFFREKLLKAGVDPAIAEEEACKLEHDISEKTFQLLLNTYG